MSVTRRHRTRSHGRRHARGHDAARAACSSSLSCASHGETSGTASIRNGFTVRPVSRSVRLAHHSTRAATWFSRRRLSRSHSLVAQPAVG